MVLKKGRSLVIISHTPHHLAKGIVYGWGPTVKEINSFINLFDKITHIAPLHAGPVPKTASEYVDGITYKPISPFGGHTLSDKLGVFKVFIEVKSILNEELTTSKILHIRLPMGLGNVLLPYLKFMRKNKIWFKYAGNLDQDNAPLGYLFQRFSLSRFFKNSIVTCNGSNRHMPSHYLHFENPCLTESDIISGKKAYENKIFDKALKVIFVGHIAPSKGVLRIIKMIQALPSTICAQLEDVTFIGEGDTEKFIGIADLAKLPIPVKFVGGLSREKLNSHYTKAHIIVLPSESEGFPKVIAEAAAHGCIPAVSDVSTIRKYINQDNGLVFSSLDHSVMVEEFSHLVENRRELQLKARNILKIVSLFTFKYYLTRISNEVLARL